MALSSRLYDYDIISLDLGTARASVAQGLTKKINSLTVTSISSGATLSVKLNATTNDAITLSSGLYIAGVPITELYWVNSAQAGKSAEIFIAWID